MLKILLYLFESMDALKINSFMSEIMLTLEDNEKLES
jgi:hypothetical protein